MIIMTYKARRASHCAISCSAIRYRRRLRDIAQCAEVCDTTTGDFLEIARDCLASQGFEHVQKLSQASSNCLQHSPKMAEKSLRTEVGEEELVEL